MPMNIRSNSAANPASGAIANRVIARTGLDLSHDHRIQALIALRVAADRKYVKDPWSFLAEQAWTADEATQSVKPWPQWPYLKELVQAVHSERLVAIPKSRRMFVSWALAGYCWWAARYWPNHAILWQSETESKAAFVVDKRCQWLENHLTDPFLRRDFAPIKTAEGQVGRMTYSATGSWIMAIAQGANVYRSYTPSILVIDESDFQPRAVEALAAALPFAEKGAKLVLVSTSNGPRGPLAEICRETGFTRWT